MVCTSMRTTSGGTCARGATRHRHQRPGVSLQSGGCRVQSSKSNSALLLEVDGAMVDLHMDGHRVAFNRAFADLSFECTQWSPSVYNDLLGCGDGTGEGLVWSYFETIGWPLFVETAQRHVFTRKVHERKQEMLREMIGRHQIPLRPGVAELVEDALKAGAMVGCIAGTLSSPEDDVVSCALSHLSPECTSKVQVFTSAMFACRHEGEQSLEETVQSAMAKSRQREAESFVHALRSSSGRESIAVDPNLLVAGSSSLPSSWVSAILAVMGVAAPRCVVVAANHGTVSAAAAAGAVAVAVPRRMSRAGTYPGAKAKFEGFDQLAGGATWGRLSKLIERQ